MVGTTRVVTCAGTTDSITRGPTAWLVTSCIAGVNLNVAVTSI